jgi:hypothetical protein
VDRRLPAIYFLLKIGDLLIPLLNREINIPGFLSAIFAIVPPISSRLEIVL